MHKYSLNYLNFVIFVDSMFNISFTIFFIVFYLCKINFNLISSYKNYYMIEMVMKSINY